jgi:hypothetical protein
LPVPTDSNVAHESEDRGRARNSLETRPLLPSGLGDWHLCLSPTAGEGTLTCCEALSLKATGSTSGGGGRSWTTPIVSHGTRAKGKVRKFCRANGVSFLWTLTYEIARGTRAEVVRDLRRFYERLQGAYGRLPCLAVIERGKRGTHRLHVHLGVDRWLNIDVLRDLWGHGHVWVGDGTKCPGNPGTKRLSRYLAKYVSKDAAAEELGQADREKGAHRYLVTQGFTVQAWRRRFHTVGDAQAWLRQAYGVPVHVVAFGDPQQGGLYGYWLDFDDAALWEPPWTGDA